MKTFVLRAWATDDTPPGGAQPLELFELDAQEKLVSLASHGLGVAADAAFVLNNEARNFNDILAQSNLTNGNLVMAAGKALYERLSLGQVGIALGNIPGKSRVRLDFRTPALEHLPWELLRRDGFALFCSANQPWSRGGIEQLKVPAHLQPVDMDPPLRVLIVIGSPRDDKKVKGDDELHEIEDELNCCASQMLVQALVRPTAAEIMAAFQEFRPHVFHFVGHGARANGQPVLRVSNENGQTENWDANRVRSALQGGAVPHLVVLNACDTALPLDNWDLAGAFIGAGVNAVLAMQAEIAGTAAVHFSRGFYMQIAAGMPIDVAAARARNDLATVAAGTDPANWPVPRLVVRGDIDKLLPRAKRSRVPRPSVRATDDFVDRFDQRKKAWDVVCPSRTDRPRLLVIEGPPQSGKTELLKVLGEMWIQTWDYEAVYVGFSGEKATDARVLLDQTMGAMEAAQLTYAPLKSVAAGLSNDALCNELRAALEQCVREKKLLLVLLDDLQRWDSLVAVQIVLEQFCAPYATPDAQSRVRMAVALPTDLSRKMNWQDDYGIEPIQVDHFSRPTWILTAPQFIRIHYSKLAENIRDIFRDTALKMAGMVQAGTLSEEQEKFPEFKASRLGVIRGFAKTL
jgi:hypothetical protein